MDVFQQWYEERYKRRRPPQERGASTPMPKGRKPSVQASPKELLAEEDALAFECFLDEVASIDTEFPELDAQTPAAKAEWVHESPLDDWEYLAPYTGYEGWEEDALGTEIINKVGQRTYLVVVCYDISEPKRLSKAAKACLRFGNRVQKSVYECHLTLQKYQRLVNVLVGLINEEQDYLRIYRLAGRQEVRVWGNVPLTEDEPFVIIG